jgi:CRP/FNR family transcriptional regulator, nitrogen oxide reductase regulator
MNCGCKLSPRNQIVGLPGHLKPRLLSGLRESDLKFLLSAAKHRQFRASSVIVHQDDPAEHFFLLTSGQGRHFAMTNKGQKIVLFWLTAGQIFGGASILETRSQYLASTEVVADSCVWMWDRRTMREFVSRCPRLLDNCLSIAVTEHTAWFIASQQSLSSNDARGRVAHLLMSLASGIGRVTASGIELRITNEDLSAGANVTPFTVSRILSDWQRAGVLMKGRGKVLLRRPFLLASAWE